MDYRSYEKRLDYVLELIQKNRLRSLEDTAKRFGCSTRTIKRMLNHLRDRGHEIVFDRKHKKYVLKKMSDIFCPDDPPTFTSIVPLWKESNNF